ncbi:hypothetical protein LTR56_014188 [Elasticomyces elasticus]|nr:hypothetical protein LTR56_014188 [Elasticomyces elasticus]KAK3645245.1 hypothetical protein LTR22_014823 [Elasticomyces elasticus]KAK4917354.1 hypothetical protein LTR49_014708 [Elasticomyces elasticus]KAK5755088.1 hypothetical protein LTS12_014771 [Elasticomyces elasticus]
MFEAFFDCLLLAVLLLCTDYLAARRFAISSFVFPLRNVCSVTARQHSARTTLVYLGNEDLVATASRPPAIPIIINYTNGNVMGFELGNLVCQNPVTEVAHFVCVHPRTR